jgi:Protein of unknown function (DUF2934)
MSTPSPNENDAIARRAYELWEAEGRPNGKDREHWEQAARELGAPAPMPEDYRDGADLPGLEAASRKPAARRRKATSPEEEAPTEATDPPATEPAKPARRRRSTTPS